MYVFIHYYLYMYVDISVAWTDTQKSKPSAQIMKGLPSAPRSATAPNIDPSRLPKNPPFTVFIGNLSYEASEEDVIHHFDKHKLTVKIYYSQRYIHLCIHHSKPLY